jgi:hypothetical protein
MFKRFFLGLLSLFGFGPKKPKPAAQPRRTYTRIGIPSYTGDGPPPPGHWKSCHPSTRRRFKAELTCLASHSISLKNHTVAANGEVNPSVVCLSPGCQFHEFVKLEGWTDGPLG